MKSSTRVCLVNVFCLAAIASTASGAVQYVDVGGGGDFLTIQEGIDAAAEGDTVLVAPGTYTGTSNRDLNPAGKNVSLISEEGPWSTTIDCEDAARGIQYQAGEGPSSRLSGFTIRNGYAYYGGAVYCVGTSPTIDHCVFVNNSVELSGGVMLIVANASPAISNCIFDSNQAHDITGSGGGAIYCEQFSAPEFTNCIFSNNSADQNGGAVCCFFALPSFTSCMFIDNDAYNLGGAVMAGANSALTIHESTLCDNSAYEGSAVFASQSPVTITNTVMALNVVGNVVGCTGSEPEITHSIVFRNAGSDSLCGNYHDNLFADPLFCSESQQDYGVHADSPCLPPNNTWGEQIGSTGDGGCGTGILESPANGTLALHPPSPNPFTGSAVIGYTCPAGATDLEVAVYNAAGRRVRTLTSGARPVGDIPLVWNGRDDRGEKVASGVYFIRAASGGNSTAGKLMLLR